MSSRSQFDTVAIDSEGDALSGIEATVNLQGTGTPATIYSTRTGGGTLANPITTDASGLVQFWADPGSYDVIFHDPNLPARISDRTIVFEAVSGRDDGIDWDQIDSDTIVLELDDIPDGLITDAKISSGAAIDPTKIDTADGRLKLTSGVITASANYSQSTTISGSDFGFSDMSGTSTTITPDVASYLVCILSADCLLSTGGSQSLVNGFVEVAVNVDGSRQTRNAIWNMVTQPSSVSNTYRAVVHQTLRVGLTAASHTVKLQAHANLTSGNTTGTVNKDHTALVWFLIAQ